MLLYIVTEAVTIQTPRLFKYIVPTATLDKAPAERIHLMSHGEFEVLRNYLTDLYGSQRCGQLLRVASDEELGRWHKFPPRLGRRSLGLVTPGEVREHYEEAAPLVEQLRQLRHRHAGKRFFRLAIVNGFGANLGDSVMGAAALRQLLEVLRRELPTFAIDLLLGMSTNPACAELLRVGPEVEREYSGSLSLSEFARYDAYFDFSALINYPRFYELQGIDFCLWWLGLDPEAVPRRQRRNAVVILESATRQVAAMLADLPRPLVLFSHQASVPLRSFPDRPVRRFIRRLLEQDQTLTLVTNHRLSFNSPRLVDLSSQIVTVELLKALVAQVDGVITVDTVVLHLADAAAMPTVLLSSAIPAANLVCNYPHSIGIEIPDASTLPGWRKAKVTEAEWVGMAQRYEDSWSRLDATAVIAALAQRRSERQGRLGDAPAQISAVPARRRPPLVQLDLDREFPRLQPRRRAVGASWSAVQQRMNRIGQQLLHRGCVALLAGGGCGELSIAVADAVGADGQVHVFEPRRMYMQILCANAVLAGIDWLHVHRALPVLLPEDGIRPEIVDLDLFSLNAEQRTGNCHERVALDCQSIDSLELPMCRLLIIQQPMPPAAVLDGSIATLGRCRPVLMITAVSRQQTDELAERIAKLDYRCYLDSTVPSGTASGQHGQGRLLLGVPVELTAELTAITAGMIRLKGGAVRQAE